MPTHCNHKSSKALGGKRGAKVNNRNLGKRFVFLLATIVVSGWSTGCVFVGTPEEEILRTGGNIELLSGGGSAVTLSGTRVGDHHMFAVAALGGNHPKFEPVRKLHLSKSKVSDVGLDALGELTSLESLILHHTRVTDVGVERFRDRVPNCQITHD